MRGRIKRAFAVAILAVVSSPTLAKWVVYGASLNFPSMSVEAKAPTHNITAYLKIECPKRTLAGLPLTVILDQNVPKTGSVGWSIQFDSGEIWHYSARRLLETTHIQLEELQGNALKVLQAAKRLRLTLEPTVGDELAYDFDVSGGAIAIEKLNCR